MTDEFTRRELKAIVKMTERSQLPLGEMDITVVREVRRKATQMLDEMGHKE